MAVNPPHDADLVPEPRWIVLTKRRRITLRDGRLRFERVVLTDQTNPVDAGAWLDEHHRRGRTQGGLVPYIILEHFSEGISPIRVADPTPLIQFSREAHDPRTALMHGRI